MTNYNEALAAAKLVYDYLDTLPDGPGPGPEPKPDPEPEPPPDSFPGYDRVHRYRLVASGRTEIFGFGPNNLLICEFRTGPAAMNSGKIGAAEWGTEPQARVMCVSPHPGDFSKQPSNQATSCGTSVTVRFFVGGQISARPVLKPNTTYYANIRMQPGASGPCDMFVDYRPAGAAGEARRARCTQQ